MVRNPVNTPFPDIILFLASDETNHTLRQDTCFSQYVTHLVYSLRLYGQNICLSVQLSSPFILGNCSLDKHKKHLAITQHNLY